MQRFLDNNSKDGSVNDPEVLTELIERMNSKNKKKWTLYTV